MYVAIIKVYYTIAVEKYCANHNEISDISSEFTIQRILFDDITLFGLILDDIKML